MNELTRFIRERAGEEEVLAGHALPGPWTMADGPGGDFLVAIRHASGTVALVSYAGNSTDAAGMNAAHIARHHPARTAAEIALYRAIAGRYESDVRAFGEGLSVPSRRLAVATAAIWSDHPDHVQDWPLGDARYRGFR